MAKDTKCKAHYTMSDKEGYAWIKSMKSAAAGNPQNGDVATGGKSINILDIPDYGRLPKKAPR